MRCVISARREKKYRIGGGSAKFFRHAIFTLNSRENIGGAKGKKKEKKKSCKKSSGPEKLVDIGGGSPAALRCAAPQFRVHAIHASTPAGFNPGRGGKLSRPRAHRVEELRYLETGSRAVVREQLPRERCSQSAPCRCGG